MNADAKTAVPLRVLQVNSLMDGGGADNQTLELTAGLRDLGCEMTLAIPAGCRWEARARSLGVRVVTFPPKSPLKRDMMRCIAATVRRERIQIVHAHQGRDYWPAILGSRLSFRRTRIVVTRHLMTHPRWFSRWFLLPNVDVITVSRAVQNVLQNSLHGRSSQLHQIFCGLDVRKFQSAPPESVRQFRAAHNWTPEHVVFGVVGAFGLPRGKGQLEFVEAAAKVRANFPQARFAIIGEGNMRPLLESRIAALQLESIVRIIPFTEEIAVAMNALDVLAHPAVGSEAFGLVILEAMACGKPVVASRLDGIPELFTDGAHGFLTPPGNVPALADAMQKLLADSALRERFGAAGRMHAAQFAREIMARRTLDLYRSLL
jgi:glycosyltransferase involved in cell wall biosynthesis